MPIGGRKIRKHQSHSPTQSRPRPRVIERPYPREDSEGKMERGIDDLHFYRVESAHFHWLGW
jgi:hypothetical protein